MLRPLGHRVGEGAADREMVGRRAGLENRASHHADVLGAKMLAELLPVRHVADEAEEERGLLAEEHVAGIGPQLGRHVALLEAAAIGQLLELLKDDADPRVGPLHLAPAELLHVRGRHGLEAGGVDEPLGPAPLELAHGDARLAGLLDGVARGEEGVPRPRRLLGVEAGLLEQRLVVVPHQPLDGDGHGIGRAVGVEARAREIPADELLAELGRHAVGQRQQAVGVVEDAGALVEHDDVGLGLGRRRGHEDLVELVVGLRDVIDADAGVRLLECLVDLHEPQAGAFGGVGGVPVPHGEGLAAVGGGVGVAGGEEEEKRRQDHGDKASGCSQGHSSW